jgi:hypothetical protein
MEKKPLSDLVIPVLLLVDGLINIFAAIFAHEMGIDPNISWGRTRFVLFFSGIILTLACLLSVYFQRKNKFISRVIKSESIKMFFMLGHIWVFIFVVYAWFITFGNFTTWNHSTHYYTQLADAFSKGQLYVDRSPGKALLESPDPYSQVERPTFPDEVWDMSLYKGKLYLYWGAVPALLITPIQLIINGKIADIFLVYFFFAGLLVFNSLIILKLWRKFFVNIPAWNVFICIPLTGLILPILWSVNIPDVYEAAIGAGQFFLIGGIYFILAAYEHGSFDKRNLFFAGLFLACSVGSRAINVFSVIFLAAFVTVWILYNSPSPIHWIKYLQTVMPFFIPLVFGAIAIGWYNWARFDSPLEFGLRYQITIFNLNKQMDQVFKPDYFPLNVYGYIFQPFEFISKFPFIQPTTNADLLSKLNIVPPFLYAAGRVTGLLFFAPFLVLGLIPLFPNIKKDLPVNAKPYKLFVYLLAGSFLIGFLTILFYFFGQMRFLVDVISQITLLAIIGYWRLISRSQRLNSTASKYFVRLANLLIVITICVSLLLAFTSETSRMGTLNPLLFEKINSFFNISQ